MIMICLALFLTKFRSELPYLKFCFNLFCKICLNDIDFFDHHEDVIIGVLSLL